MQSTCLNDRVVIIAGGPTVGEYDLSLIGDKATVMGVNESFIKAPCHVGITMDRLWIQDRLEYVLNSDKDFWVRHAAVKFIKKEIADRKNIRLFECNESYELSDDWRVINGTNSGMCALNWAYHMKPKEIFLLGFDMTVEKDKPYWYDPYQWVNPQWGGTKPARYKRWIQQFVSIAYKLNTMKMNTYNVTHNSGLNCFPKITFEDCIRRISNE